MTSNLTRWFVLGAALLGAVSGCGEEEKQAPLVTGRPVRTMLIGGTVGGDLTFPGRVQGADRADLAFRVAGPLITFPVDEGDVMEKGQILARIDPRDFEIAVAESKASYEKSEADAKRYQRLYEREAVPLADLELRRAQRDVSRARYDQARADLRDTYLRAPFRGQVGRKFVENFERVRISQKIVSLHNVDAVEIVIDVPEQLIAYVEPGGGPARLGARFETASGIEFPLTFKEVAAEADQQTQTYKVTLSMPQPDEINVLPGMSATVVAHADDATGIVEPTTFAIPAVATLGGEDGRPKVWVVDTATNTVHAREVTLGPVTGTSDVFVMSGISVGETIVVTAVHQLAEGDEITILEDVRIRRQRDR